VFRREGVVMLFALGCFVGGLIGAVVLALCHAARGN
jgi:hypothetical protein